LTLIMQNKANFKKARINVSYYLQKDYENESCRRLWGNKPNPSTWFGSFDTSTNLSAGYAQDRFAHHRSLKTGQSQSFDGSTALTAGFAQDKFFESADRRQKAEDR